VTAADPGSFDRHMMAIALRMASRGLGQTWPNPSVGAVIADERTGELIARAVTARGGRPHAETQAIELAGTRARGKTLYVTLEPCAHTGRTAPCADAVIAAGLSRVVVAIEDPDPRVAGRGLDRLRAAGIAVTRGMDAAQARWITRGHVVRITERRPLVTLKMALDSDGKIVRGNGNTPIWVTGEAARAHGAMLRARSDAILVGSGTVRDDDPQLTCRLPGMMDRSPVRIVLARNLNLLLTSKLVKSAHEFPVWLMSANSGDASPKAKLLAAGCEIEQVTTVQGQLWLPSVMEALVARGITRLLVEGGPTIWRAFADAGLVDEVVLYMAEATEKRSEQESTLQACSALQAWLGPVPLTLSSHANLETDRMWRFRRPLAKEGS
jgi:diaminohydroxyphosphoribosylaminopyrimidine deaminase/5-amino-6-(5-phosphoribosylamino)uracil reductase